jgi:hypothetical protein
VSDGDALSSATITASIDQRSEVLVEAWRRDHAAADGGYERFEAALETTWREADAAAALASDEFARATAIGLQALCGLLSASRVGMANEMPPGALATAVEVGLLSLPRALAVIRWMEVPAQRAALRALAPALPEADRLAGIALLRSTLRTEAYDNGGVEELFHLAAAAPSAIRDQELADLIQLCEADLPRLASTLASVLALLPAHLEARARSLLARPEAGAALELAELPPRPTVLGDAPLEGAALDGAIAQAREVPWPLGRAEALLDVLALATRTSGEARAALAREVCTALEEHLASEGGPERHVRSHSSVARIQTWRAGADELLALAPPSERPALTKAILALATHAHDEDREALAVGALARALPLAARGPIVARAVALARASVRAQIAPTIAKVLDVVPSAQLELLATEAYGRLGDADPSDQLRARLRLLAALANMAESGSPGLQSRLIAEVREALTDGGTWLDIHEELARLPDDIRRQLPPVAEPRRRRRTTQPEGHRAFEPRWRDGLRTPAWRGRADALFVIETHAAHLVAIPGAVEAVMHTMRIARREMP